MFNDRRDFLKVFGVTSAAIATSTTAKGTEFEVLKDSSVEPLSTEFPPGKISGQGVTPRRHYLDVVEGQLYSAMEVEADTPLGDGWEHNFFGYDGAPTPMLLGGRCPDLRDTNLCRRNQLYAPESFLVRRFGLLFSPTCNPVDRSRLVESFCLELWLGQKEYCRFPASDLFYVGEPTVNESERTNPGFPVKYLHTLEIPLIIQNQMSFFSSLRGTKYFRPEQRMKFWVVLEGLHARGVC